MRGGLDASPWTTGSALKESCPRRSWSATTPRAATTSLSVRSGAGDGTRRLTSRQAVGAGPRWSRGALLIVPAFLVDVAFLPVEIVLLILVFNGNGPIP